MPYLLCVQCGIPHYIYTGIRYCLLTLLFLQDILFNINFKQYANENDFINEQQYHTFCKRDLVQFFNITSSCCIINVFYSSVYRLLRTNTTFTVVINIKLPSSIKYMQIIQFNRISHSGPPRSVQLLHWEISFPVELQHFRPH